jgi:hypothetical protein
VSIEAVQGAKRCHPTDSVMVSNRRKSDKFCQLELGRLRERDHVFSTGYKLQFAKVRQNETHETPPSGLQKAGLAIMLAPGELPG